MADRSRASLANILDEALSTTHAAGYRRGFRLRAFYLRNPKNSRDQELFRDGDINKSSACFARCNMMGCW